MTPSRQTFDRAVTEADDRLAVATAIENLASSLDRPAEHPDDLAMSTRSMNAEPSVLAFRIVGRHLGLDLDREPAAGVELDLVEWLESNHVRHRQVALDEGWWRHDCGPIVGSRIDPGSEAEPSPVALLPTGKAGYEMIDPATGRREPVTTGSAAKLAPHGRILFRRLPGRPLGWIDLLRAGWRDQRRDAALLWITGLACGLLALAVPIATGRLVDRGLVPADRPVVFEMVAALLVAAVTAALFQLFYSLLLLRAKSRLDGSLQAALWDRLLSLPTAFYRRFTVGDLGARAMGLDQIRTLLTRDVTALLLSSLSLLVGWALLFYYSWPMALVATGLSAALVVVMLTMAVRQLRHERVLQHHRGRLASLVYALLGGIEKLRVGQAEARAFATWADRFSAQRRHDIASRRLANHQATFTAVYGIVGSIAVFAIVAWTAGAGLSLGEFLAFHAAYGQAQASLFSILSTAPTLLAFIPTYERVRPILEATPESAEGRRDPGRLRGEIALRDVSFRYGDGPWVLQELSFRIEPGEFVALVGPSGSGKSTCLRLLLGFEQPTRGEVTIDGSDLAELDLHLVRRQLGVVLQNHLPTAGDIFHNIAGGRALSMDDAWRVARLVGLAEEIERLPMGMLTVVNRRGVTFSGGQRQRMLLARAIAHDPRILLLDEATSALDNRTQELVTRSLEDLGVSRLVIAHRLSTIRHADRILVLERGRLVEEGTYDTLIRTDGLFRDMAQRQQISI